MKIAICDDDKIDTQRLSELLEKYSTDKQMDIEIYTYETALALLAVMPENEWDIIFLDINMEGMDGLNLAEKIREKQEYVPIILVTAFINYALDGYKVRASRFLVKDNLDKTLPECMDDVCRQIQKKTKNMIFDCVEGDVDIELIDIVFVETTGHRSIIHLKSEDYHIYESMDEIESKLKMYGFIRVHKSFLVNVRHIRGINNYVCTLDTGYEIRVPKARYKQVRQERALYVGKLL